MGPLSGRSLVSGCGRAFASPPRVCRPRRRVRPLGRCNRVVVELSCYVVHPGGLGVVLPLSAFASTSRGASEIGILFSSLQILHQSVCCTSSDPPCPHRIQAKAPLQYVVRTVFPSYSGKSPPPICCTYVFTQAQIEKSLCCSLLLCRCCMDLFVVPHLILRLSVQTAKGISDRENERLGIGRNSQRSKERNAANRSSGAERKKAKQSHIIREGFVAE